MSAPKPKRMPCWFVVIHCADAEQAARIVNELNPAAVSEPRILRGGERLGKKGECY